MRGSATSRDMGSILGVRGDTFLASRETNGSGGTGPDSEPPSRIFGIEQANLPMPESSNLAYTCNLSS